VLPPIPSPVLARALGALALLLAGCGGSAGALASSSSSTSSAGAPPPQTRGESPATARPAALERPPIQQWPIPFAAARRREMAAYSLRHYGEDTAVLSNPKVIVEHFTETATAQEAFDTFAPDVPDSEFDELPNTCAHFLVEPSGRIDQLVPLALRCRHTTGLNWTAIGIEHVGFSDRQVLDDAAQLRASLRLTRWLRCRYGIAVANVIGHNESLSSPYHRDLVPAFRHQTHSDFKHADMRRYRAMLRRLTCPGA
jgi:N-acetylmuramoyl-L-alanine amidase